MKRFRFNAQYFTTPLLIALALAMLGIVVGGAWMWTGVGLFGVAALLDYWSQ